MTQNPNTNAETFESACESLFGSGILGEMQRTGRAFFESKRGKNSFEDETGREVLDWFNGAGIYNLGRRNAELADALKQAAHETDQGNFPMISMEKAALAEALARFLPGDLECSVFSVVRGEALEFACKVARGATGRRKLLSLEGAWHGQTGFALSLSTRADATLYGPLIPETQALSPDTQQAFLDAIDTQTAAVIVEPIQVENHCRALDPEWLGKLQKRCRNMGALLIVDETQTGFGRSGEKFAFLESGLEPDVLILGEALGGGMFPIAATVITQEVNRFMNEHPMIHLSTFGGSDIGCRVALKALELYESEKPWDKARDAGCFLEKDLEDLQKKHAKTLLSVQGSGGVFSLEFADEAAADEFVRRAAQEGILLTTGEVAKNTVVLRPPLNLDESERKRAIDMLDTVFDTMKTGKETE